MVIVQLDIQTENAFDKANFSCNKNQRMLGTMPTSNAMTAT